jgi:quercetin dioxygenase-like cupin family protein
MHRQCVGCGPRGADAGARAAARGGWRPYAARMTYRLRNASAITTGPGSHPAASPYDKCIGDELGIHAFGLYQVELPAGAETVRHNHRDDAAEDAYAFLRGSGVVVVDEDQIRVGPGDFIAVTPDSDRHVRADDCGLVFIAMCAPVAS